MICFLDVLSTTHKDSTGVPISEKSFLNELSNILPNVKDWEHGRKNRDEQHKS